MLINPVRNPSIFRRRFPIRSCYPSQHLLRQNPLPRSQFRFRRRFPRAASEPRAVALRRVNARKSFGPNCSLARRMEEEYSASLRPGPQSQMAEPLLLKCCRRSFTAASQYYQKPTAVDAVVRGKLGLKRQADGLANPNIAPAPGGHLAAICSCNCDITLAHSPLRGPGLSTARAPTADFSSRGPAWRVEPRSPPKHGNHTLADSVFPVARQQAAAIIFCALWLSRNNALESGRFCPTSADGLQHQMKVGAAWLENTLGRTSSSQTKRDQRATQSSVDAKGDSAHI